MRSSQRRRRRRQIERRQMLSAEERPDESPVPQLDDLPEGIKPHATQFAPEPEGGRAVDLVIGLDFGTAITKVVIRSPYEHGDRAIAVPFVGHAPSEEEYFLASRVVDRADGSVTLCPADCVAVGGGSLKWRLLMKPGPRTEVEAVAFLACVLRHARCWFLETQEKGYRGARLRWSVQLGMPSESDDDVELRTRYEGVGRAAWLLSVTKGAISSERAADAIGCAADGVEAREPLSDLGVITEVAAEVAGYARSDLRRSGLHFLVDVGAATLDVAGFILHENDEGDLYPILQASVTQRGTLALQWARCAALAEAATRPLDPLPESFLDWAAGHGAARQALAEAEAEFQAECRKQVGELVREVRLRRDPNAAAWTEGVPVFLCGGGRDARIYKDALGRLNGALAKAFPDWPGFRDLRMGPGQEQLVAPRLSKKTYHRLAVAWGLSIPQDDIGRVVRSAEIEDIEVRRERADLPEFVGPEQT
jgi:hypothetical protein